MKHIIYIYSIFTVVLAFVSCTKQSIDKQSVEISVTASLGSGEIQTRTYLSGVSTLWQENDSICINGLNSTLLQGQGTAQAGFKTTALGKGVGCNEFIAGYPASTSVYKAGAKGAVDTMIVNIPSRQSYNPTESLLGQMPMAAFGKSDYDDNLTLSFKNVANILYIKLWGNQQKISSIEIVCPTQPIAGNIAVTPNGENDITIGSVNGAGVIKLDCETPVTLSSDAANPTVFPVLIAKLNSACTLKIKLLDDIGDYQNCTLSIGADNDLCVSTNKIVKTSSKKFAPTQPSGTIGGAISVSATKKVLFSKGNLWCDNTNPDAPVFYFEDQQYYYRTIGNNIVPSGKGTPHSLLNDYYDPTHSPDNTWGLFASSTVSQDSHWGMDVYTSYQSTVHGPAYKEWGQNPIANAGNKPNQWRVLSEEEWKYLLSTRITSSPNRYSRATITLADGKTKIFGLIIYYDNFDSSQKIKDNATITYDKWQSMESAGAVFLPLAGDYNGSGIGHGMPDNEKIAYYHTSSKQVGAQGGFRLSFGPGEGIQLIDYLSWIKRSVRLVRDLSESTTEDFTSETW